MGWAFSTDDGKSWKRRGSAEGDFDWEIDACVPWEGLAIEEKKEAPKLHAVVWTGNQRNAGLYYLSRQSKDSNVRIGGVEHFARHCGFGKRANRNCLDPANLRGQQALLP